MLTSLAAYVAAPVEPAVTLLHSVYSHSEESSTTAQRTAAVSVSRGPVTDTPGRANSAQFVDTVTICGRVFIVNHFLLQPLHSTLGSNIVALDGPDGNYISFY